MWRWIWCGCRAEFVSLLGGMARGMASFCRWTLAAAQDPRGVVSRASISGAAHLAGGSVQYVFSSPLPVGWRVFVSGIQ